MKPLNHIVWSDRLQILWILLAAIYSFIEQITKNLSLTNIQRLSISSSFVSITTLLISLMLAHSIYNIDINKLKNTMKTALVATVFIALTSINFKDNTALIGAIIAIFPLVFTGWLLKEETKEKNARLIIGVLGIFFSVSFSLALGLILTLWLKKIGYSDYLVIAPAGLGSLSCLFCGVTLGKNLYRKVLELNQPKLYNLQKLYKIIGLVIIYSFLGTKTIDSTWITSLSWKFHATLLICSTATLIVSLLMTIFTFYIDSWIDNKFIIWRLVILIIFEIVTVLIFKKLAYLPAIILIGIVGECFIEINLILKKIIYLSIVGSMIGSLWGLLISLFRCLTSSCSIDIIYKHILVEYFSCFFIGLAISFTLIVGDYIIKTNKKYYEANQ